MSDIVLWYDCNEKNNCQFQDAVLGRRTILHKLMISNIDYKIKTTDQILNAEDVNLYVIELANVYNDYDIFSLIPQRTKKLLSKGLMLVLYYPTEGHLFDDWLLRIYKNLETNSIATKKIFFVNGNLDLEVHYKDYILQHNLKDFLIPISMDFFKGEYYETSSNFNNDIETEKTKDYLFYNGKVRPHRLLAVAELKNRNLLANGLVSLTATTHSGESFNFDSCVTILKKHKCYNEHVEMFIKEWRPMILDELPENFSKNTVYGNSINHYSQTFFSIVSETNIDVKFITEKIYKPIANQHPFIVLGASGILKWLRSQGYETFPEMFDESYDQETEHAKRIYMILDQVEKFCNLSIEEKQKKFNSIKHKLIHNKEHYFSSAIESSKKEFENLIRIIKKYED